MARVRDRELVVEQRPRPLLVSCRRPRPWPSVLTLSEVVAQRAATKLDVSVWSRLAVVSVIGLNGTLVTVLEADDDLGVVSTTEGGTDRHPRAHFRSRSRGSGVRYCGVWCSYPTLDRTYNPLGVRIRVRLFRKLI